jgi:hypothetical protein
MYVTFCNTLHPPFLVPLPLAHVALDPEAHVPPTQNNRHATVKIHTSRISMLGELEMSMPTLSPEISADLPPMDECEGLKSRWS